MAIRVYLSTLLNSGKHEEAQDMIISAAVLWKESTGPEINRLRSEDIYYLPVVRLVLPLVSRP